MNNPENQNSGSFSVAFVFRAVRKRSRVELKILQLEPAWLGLITIIYADSQIKLEINLIYLSFRCPNTTFKHKSKTEWSNSSMSIQERNEV